MSNAISTSIGLSQAERDQITTALRTVHEIMLRHDKVKMTWSGFSGTAADGRVIVHRFTVQGYVKSEPQHGAGHE